MNYRNLMKKEIRQEILNAPEIEAVRINHKLYSEYNSKLISYQGGTDDMYATFIQWGNKGRSVKKGAKGYAVLVNTCDYTIQQALIDPQTGEDIPEERALDFRFYYVFALKDTEVL